MNAKEVELSEQDYDDWLNELDGPIHVAGMTFDAATILYKCDPIAYRCGFSDYESFMREDDRIDWECGECGEVYSGRNAEEDAEKCCMPEDIDAFPCVCCGTTYETEQESIDCECGQDEPDKSPEYIEPGL